MRELDEAIEAMEKIAAMDPTTDGACAKAFDDAQDIARTALAALKRVREGAVEGHVYTNVREHLHTQGHDLFMTTAIPPGEEHKYRPAILWVEPNEPTLDDTKPKPFMEGGVPDEFLREAPTEGRFRKKPVEVKAVQYTEADARALVDYDADDFMGFKAQEVCSEEGAIYRTGRIKVETLESDPNHPHLAEPGDWIIWGVKGEPYPCKPDIFEATYEPVEAPTDGGERETMLWRALAEGLNKLPDIDPHDDEEWMVKVAYDALMAVATEGLGLRAQPEPEGARDAIPGLIERLKRKERYGKLTDIERDCWTVLVGLAAIRAREDQTKDTPPSVDVGTQARKDSKPVREAPERVASSTDLAAGGAPFKLPVRVELGNDVRYEVWDQDNTVVANDLNEDEALYIVTALNARAWGEPSEPIGWIHPDDLAGGIDEVFGATIWPHPGADFFVPLYVLIPTDTEDDDG